jgi:hypothetical protein
MASFANEAAAVTPQEHRLVSTRCSVTTALTSGKSKT